jgi:hypothetical protein
MICLFNIEKYLFEHLVKLSFLCKNGTTEKKNYKKLSHLHEQFYKLKDMSMHTNK